MRRSIVELLLAFIIAGIPLLVLAQSGSQKSTTALNSEVASEIPDNTAGSITPFDMRQVFVDIIASYPNLVNGTGVTYTGSITANDVACWNATGVVQDCQKSGNTNKIATANGVLTSGDCVSIDSSGNFMDAGGACTTGGGGGTVSSGTAGQVAYYLASGATVTGATLALPLTIVTGTFKLNLSSPLTTTAGNLTLSFASPLTVTSGTLKLTTSGNTSTVATTSGSLVSGDCAKFDASGNIVDSGSACGTGGGGGVNPGTSGQLGYYASTGSAISGLNVGTTLAIGALTPTTLDIATNGVGNAQLAQAPAYTIKCNPTASTANEQDCTAPQLITTNDSSATLFGTGVFRAFANFANVIIAGTINNASPSTSAFPTAITGYGKVLSGSGGNQVFPIFGRCDLQTNGTCYNEMDAFNNSANPSTSWFPPNTAIGTTQSISTALLLNSFGTFAAHSALQIAGGTGSSGFLAGIYMWPACCTDWGLFIDGGVGSPPTSAVIRNNTSGVNLSLQTIGTPMVATTNVIQVLDNSSNVWFKVTENGNVTAGNNFAGAAQMIITTTDTGAGSTAQFRAVTNAGTLLAFGQTTAGGSTSALRWNGPGTMFLDAQNSLGNISLRTGATPTQAMTISASQVINLPAVTTGTPAASLCLDGSGNIIKKTTAGSCI